MLIRYIIVETTVVVQKISQLYYNGESSRVGIFVTSLRLNFVEIYYGGRTWINT